MLGRVLVTGLTAGLLAGLFAAAIQISWITPIIQEAEIYESAEAPTGAPDPASRPGTSGAPFVLPATQRLEGDEGAWAPEDGIERTLFTMLANVLTGVGFGLILVAAVTLSGRHVDPGRGVLWGLAGFAVFALAPALGLPPELPGMVAADLGSRQTWWIGTVISTAGGLALIVFARHRLLKGLGVALLLAPHAVGAPHPGQFGGKVPGELAAEFAVASLFTAALFWTALGGIAGYFHRKISCPPEIS
ncbi:MAG: CbtA family protein [Alphaproteobacteria bacterium]|nr:CbtA family protein [Alphaproteobacteria bacterium]